MNRLQIRRTSTPGKVPTTTDLLLAELGINTADNALFVNNGSEVVQLNAANKIAQDTTHRFVTDAQIAAWNSYDQVAPATTTQLGGVIIGSNISVDGDGKISVAVATSSAAGVLSAADYSKFDGKQAALGFDPVNKAGDTMTGTLVLVGDPTSTNHAANKNYVDGMGAAKVNLSGATMTGALVLNADPSANLGAATKQYVDSAVSLVGGDFNAPVGTIAELSALASNVDRQMRLVESAGAIYRFDAQSVLVADGTDVVVPDSNPALGRWIKIQAATQYHDGLMGLSGGAANDYQHLTTSEKTAYQTHLTDYALHLSVSQNNWLDAITVTATEVNHVSGATSNLQAQINNKQASLGYTPVNKAGDTMTGFLTLHADPSSDMHAVTFKALKNYTLDAGTF